MRINYFFRNKYSGYSIQVVFQTIVNHLGNQISIRNTFLPSPFANFTSILTNGIYAKRHQKEKEINHITGDVHYLLLFLNKKQTVITVHDIMYYHYLKGIKKQIWKYLYIYSLKRATYITFISDIVREQILDIVQLPKEKIFVIPNPVNPQFQFTKKEFNTIYPRILHIGTLERKNLKRTIQALKPISCHLCIVGHLDNDTITLLNKTGTDYSNIYDLDDIQIIKEYQKADIINFPSLLEGFGMPIIEGQATGRIVITSNLSPMKEVAGEGAVLVNPYSIEDIRNAYQNVLKDAVYRQTLIQKGKENVSRFTADKITEQYMQIYKLIER